MKNYPLFKVHVDVQSALKNIEQVLNSGFINEGEAVTQLTDKFKEKLETNNLIMVNSCTSALTLALHMIGVKGGNVVTTPMTCVATNCPIVNLGADIKWCDTNPKTGCIDPLDLVEVIDENTEAVMLVLWAGTVPEDFDKILQVCYDANVPIIIDAAHAMGAKYKGKYIHEYATFTCYSLQAIKHITSGDGGILVSKYDDYYELSKKLKWFGIDRDAAKDEKGNWKGQHWDFDISEAGYKFNMNNVTAAIGLSQLDKMDGLLNTHRYNSYLYNASFTNTKIQPLECHNDSESSYWVYTVLLPIELKPFRDVILKELNSRGIMAGLVHVSNHEYSCFDKYYDTSSHFGTNEFQDRQISLPCGWWLSSTDVMFIASTLNAIVDKYSKSL